MPSTKAFHNLSNLSLKCEAGCLSLFCRLIHHSVIFQAKMLYCFPSCIFGGFWHFIVTSCILWLWLFHRRNNHLCVYNGYVVLWTSVSCFFLSAACGERRFTSYYPLGGSFWFLHGNKAFRSVYPTWGWGDKTDDLWGCIDKNPLHYTTVCHCASSRSTEILNISSLFWIRWNDMKINDWITNCPYILAVNNRFTGVVVGRCAWHHHVAVVVSL